MNDGSKEPEEQDNYSTSSFEKCSWFWASVEVHIQNPNETTKRRCMRGGILKYNNKKSKYIVWLNSVCLFQFASYSLNRESYGGHWDSWVNWLKVSTYQNFFFCCCVVVGVDKLREIDSIHIYIHSLTWHEK